MNASHPNAAKDARRRDRAQLEQALRAAGAGEPRGNAIRCPFHDDRTRPRPSTPTNTASGGSSASPAGNRRWTCSTSPRPTPVNPSATNSASSAPA
jgi:hypothetical protein